MAGPASPVVASPGGPQPIPAGQIAPPPNFASTSSAATAPAFADASQTAGNQKAALLAAIAQAGSAGQAQYNALQQQNAQSRQQALQAATQREAVVQNMPPALAQQLAGMSNSGFDLNRTLLNDTSQTAAQGMGLLSAGAGNYLTELQASLPEVQADTQAKIAALQEAAYQKDTTAQNTSNVAAAKAGAAGVGPDSGITPAALEKRVGGVQTAADQLTAGAAQFAQQNGGAAGAQYQGPNLAGTQISPNTASEQPQGKDALQQAYFASVDRFNKWPAGTAASIVNQGNTKTAIAKAGLTKSDLAISASQAKNIVSSMPPGTVGRALAAIDQLNKAGQDYTQIYITMTNANPPYTADQAKALLAQYQSGSKGNQAIGGA